jgi:protein tyrosine/serine phosphatase
MSRRTSIGILTAVAVILAVAAGWAYRNHQRYKHLAEHEKGMMYRSAWLEPDVFSEVIEMHQIRAVVNLCDPGEMGEARWLAERDAVRNAGAKLIEVPMSLSIDADDPSFEEHMAILSNPDNYPMLVHCQHGVTRTAKFLAMYDIVFRGKSAEESLAAQPLFGRDEHNVNVRAFSKNFEQKHEQIYPYASADNLQELRQ